MLDAMYGVLGQWGLDVTPTYITLEYNGKPKAQVELHSFPFSIGHHYHIFGASLHNPPNY